MAKRKYFYVYALMDGITPFYIGKGQGSRKNQHFTGLPAQDKVAGSSAKHQRIAAIKAEGRNPQALVLSVHAIEEEALLAEQAVIKTIGLKNLTNMNGGGGGHKTQKRFNNLTGKQEAYAQALAKGMTQRAAYKAAGYNVKSMNTADNEACKLAANPKIAARLEQLRRPVVDKIREDNEIDAKWLVDQFKYAATLADETGAAGAYTGAVKEIGKVLDLYPAEKKDINVSTDASTEALMKGRARVASMKRDKPKPRRLK